MNVHPFNSCHSLNGKKREGKSALEEILSPETGEKQQDYTALSTFIQGGKTVCGKVAMKELMNGYRSYTPAVKLTVLQEKLAIITWHRFSQRLQAIIVPSPKLSQTAVKYF